MMYGWGNMMGGSWLGFFGGLFWLLLLILMVLAIIWLWQQISKK